MTTKKRTGLKVLLISAGVLVMITAGMLLFLSIGLGLKDAEVGQINLTLVADGTYEGRLTGSRFGNTLAVTISGGKIVDIEIIKDMVVAVPEAASGLFNAVIREQSLQIDGVSGATVSEKAYLKSIEDALNGQ